MTPAFALGATVMADTRTERFLLLRKLEKEAAAGLADAMADVGDQLLQIRMDLASSGERGWLKWLKAQAGRATSMGIEPVTDRTARNYMALARFRATSGKRFPELMTLSISCLYPVLTLPEAALAELAANGVPVEGGGTKPLGEASARELKRAASVIRRGMSGAAAPVDPFSKVVAAIKKLGPMTEEQRAQLAEMLGARVDGVAPTAKVDEVAPKPVVALGNPNGTAKAENSAPEPTASVTSTSPVRIPVPQLAAPAPSSAPELENVLRVIPGVVRAVEGLKGM